MEPSKPTHRSTSSSGSGATAGREALVGQVLGDFEIHREIGRGGMGTVYEARQISLNRTVAIKVLANSLGLTENAVIRFQREAQAAAKLHHAGIVPIYGQGVQDGIYYYAMELVPGRNAHEIITEMRGDVRTSGVDLTETKLIVGTKSAAEGSDGGPSTGDTVLAASRSQSGNSPTSGRSTAAVSESTAEGFRDIAHLTACAAEALDYAHSQGVIHRDVKPHNLICSRDGRLRITDFGLARVLEQPGVTTTGEFVGSPLYMSPEQIRGGNAVDARTDVYSLGATLYEWLTLQPPHPGETREHVISQILTTEPAPPRQINPAIPVDLETICLRSLTKLPNDRYASAGAMAHDLRLFLQGESILAKRTGVVKRIRRSIARNKVVATAITIAAAALVYGTFQRLSLQTQLEEQSARVAELEEPKKPLLQSLEESAPLETEFVRRFTEAGSELLQSLSAAAPVSAMGGATPKVPPPTRADTTDDDRTLIGHLTDELIDDLRRTTPDRMAIPGVSLPRASSADEYFREAVRATSPQEALILINSALQQDMGHFESVQLRAIVYLQLFEFSKAREDADLLLLVRRDSAGGLIMRGLAALFLGEVETCIEMLQRAQEHRPHFASLHAALGAAYARRNEFAQAFALFDRALADSPGNPAASEAKRASRKRVEESIDALTSAIAEDPTAEAFELRGDYCALLGRHDEAVADFKQAGERSGSISALLLYKQWAAKSARDGAREESFDSSMDNDREEAAPSLPSTAPPAVHVPLSPVLPKPTS